jgi:hypothetical protein
MPTDGRKLLAGYQAMDRALVAAGRHPTSEAWMESLADFWLSGATRGVWRAGRQSGKSTTCANVIAATALFGEHVVAPGSRLAFPFISVRKDESQERIYNLADTFRRLGEPYKQVGTTIELLRRPHVFATLACSMRTSVGGTAGGLVEDEVSRWWSDDANANPAHEVDAALTPFGATQPNFRIYTVSSPLGLDDFHAQLFARGNTPDQRVYEGPSWHWNPTVTEARTHALQPDERIWRREFAAQPQADVLSAFDVEAFDRCVRSAAELSHLQALGAPVVVMDSSGGGGDAFVWCGLFWGKPVLDETELFTWEPVRPGDRITNAQLLWSDEHRGWTSQRVDEHGEAIVSAEAVRAMRPRLVVFGMRAIVGKFRERGVTAEDIIAGEIAPFAKRIGARYVVGDQNQSYAWQSMFARCGVAFRALPWTNTNKADAVSALRRMMREQTIWIEDGAEAPALRSEVASFRERITSSGAISYGARNAAHDDRVAALVTGVLADREGLVTGSPTRTPNYRHEIGHTSITEDLT